LNKLGKRLNIPLVATNNVHYAYPDDRKLQDVLACIKHHKTLDDASDILYPNANRYLLPKDEIIKRFAAYPDAIENSVAIAERCDFSLDKLNTTMPDFTVPKGETLNGFLRKLTYKGAKKRYGELTEKQIAQIEHELRIISKLNLEGYFLIVWDIARFCRSEGILCQGRGSAANSAVCYCLGITAVDPIMLDLLFERFVSEERKEPPDIDIDIASDRREEVIQYVYNKYGREHAAMVCEVISYRGRSAVREVGKALGFSLKDVDKLAKLMDSYSGGEEVLERVEESGYNIDSKRVLLLIDLCQRIKRFPRHLGIHVGGMVITKSPLSEVVPIENAAMPNRSVIQWDKDDTGDAGLVKIDLLGLGMLTLIDKALKMIKRRHGVDIDMAKLTYEDPKVYDLLCDADTVGVFQVESRAQMNVLPRHKPRCFYDLVVEVALIRPGPIQGNMVHPYLRRRNGEEEITYPHPKLEPILKRTLGVPLFQEQGMKVAVAAAGYSPSQADELRRAMGHKRSHEKMEALKSTLINGMIRNGIKKEIAEWVFTQLSAFANFGFAESHAASFALLVYVSAYLKVYYPQEFYCAILNSQPMGFYSPSSVIYEARRRGVEILSVDVTKSHWECTVEGDAVRLGFKYVKSIGKSVKDRLESAIAEKPFSSIEDFVYRTGLSKSSLEQLALAGAFGCFGLNRRQALWEVLGLVRKSSSEFSLEENDSGKEHLTEMNIVQSLAADFKGTSVSTGPHIIKLMRDYLQKKGAVAADELAAIPETERVIVAGTVIIRQRPRTAKGFTFLTLEDETGFINVVVKPPMMKRYRKEIVRSGALWVEGVLEKKDGVINVIGDNFTPLNLHASGLTLKSRDFH
ncbi:MAG: DNA polymerase III subunit alpha, partial [candidate division Zixibacteria bacterium]|nr:DNA polymerase III subunit alpha [candidate division Zixibacteria bacterium]